MQLMELRKRQWGRGQLPWVPWDPSEHKQGMTVYCPKEASPAKDKDGSKQHVDTTRASQSSSEVIEIAPGRNCV